MNTLDIVNKYRKLFHFDPAQIGHAWLADMAGEIIALNSGAPAEQGSVAGELSTGNSAMQKLLVELQELFDNEDPHKCERATEIFRQLQHSAILYRCTKQKEGTC